MCAMDGGRKDRDRETETEREREDGKTKTLWSRTAKNTDSTGPLARPFARSLAPLTSLRPPLRSLVRSLAQSAHSLARGKVNYQMAILSVFFSIFDHSERDKPKKTERQKAIECATIRKRSSQSMAIEKWGNGENVAAEENDLD